MSGLAEHALTALFVANSDFVELERALDVFCPFEAVGMVRQEIRHGHFLGYIFDPNRPHGFGSDALRALMAAAARATLDLPEGLSPLDVHLMDFESARVRREWRSIDILIEVPAAKLIVAIELKIDASEHSGQLARYSAILEQEWPSAKGWRKVKLFLTKRGEDASEGDGLGWASIALDNLVSELSALRSGSPDARSMLSAYLAMLRRHHLSDERLEELAARLWAEHREALDFLADRRPDAIGQVFKRMYDQRGEIADRIAKESGLTVLTDHCTPSSLRFAVKEWDEIPGFLAADGWTSSNRLILLEVAKASKDSTAVRCYMQLGRGDGEMRRQLFNRLRASGADVGKKLEPTKEWNRLASTTFRKLDPDNPDINATADRVISDIVAFAAKHLPKYNAALATMKATGSDT